MRHYFYHTDLGQKAVFHNFAIKIQHSFNIQDDGSTRGLLAKPLNKFPKSPIRPSGCHFCSASCYVASVWMNINRVTLQYNKEFIIFFFYYYSRAHFQYSCKRWSLNDWKQSSQRWKLQERLLTINFNTRNRIRWNIYKGNNSKLKFMF